MGIRPARRADPHQIQRALILLGKAGYNTGFIDANFKRLGATASESDWTVQKWLIEKRSFEVEMLIERLQNETPGEVRSRLITPAF